MGRKQPKPAVEVAGTGRPRQGRLWQRRPVAKRCQAERLELHSTRREKVQGDVEGGEVTVVPDAAAASAAAPATEPSVVAVGSLVPLAVDAARSSLAVVSLEATDDGTRQPCAPRPRVAV